MEVVDGISGVFNASNAFAAATTTREVLAAEGFWRGNRPEGWRW